jgi:hypothetical protein
VSHARDSRPGARVWLATRGFSRFTLFPWDAEQADFDAAVAVHKPIE